MTTVQDTINAFQEAAKAFEREPGHLAQIDELSRQLANSANHNAELEINIRGYKDQIDQLQAKVRSLEVERDDASFRLLEAEDKLVAYANLVEVFTSNAAKLSPKPQPNQEVVFEDVKQAVQGTVSEPFVGPGGGSCVTATATGSAGAGGMGQSVDYPTQSVPSTESQSPSAPSTVASEEPVVAKPYEGKR